MTKEGRETLGEKQSAKEYSKPTRVEYGRVEEITKGNVSGTPDLGGQVILK
jgi:hypothetical protein